MLLTITNDTQPATDLGYLLHKNPSRSKSLALHFGNAHIFYPEARLQRYMVALLLDVDPVGLVRKRRGSSGEGHALAQYVNDRPYVASSFMSVAIAKAFGTALSGRSKERQALVEKPMILEAKLAVVPCRGGEPFLRRLFEPLGYEVTATRHALDLKFPEWGSSPYFSVRLQATVCLRDLLTHLYVLIPVLDDEKHYWVGDEEVEKLLRHGEGWLASHPDRQLIARRYLRHQRSLVREALSRLVDEDNPDPDQVEETHAEEEADVERRISLNEQRLGAVVAALKSGAAERVLDLACGEGKLLRLLLEDKTFKEIVGMDVSYRALEIAKERLHLDRLPAKQREPIQLIQGSLTYRDKRLALIQVERRWVRTSKKWRVIGCPSDARAQVRFRPHTTQGPDKQNPPKERSCQRLLSSTICAIFSLQLVVAGARGSWRTISGPALEQVPAYRAPSVPGSAEVSRTSCLVSPRALGSQSTPTLRHRSLRGT